MLNDIAAFHTKFGLGYPLKGPRQLGGGEVEFRIKFMQEELDEYIKAVQEDDLVGQFDALIDLVYVALGTAYLQNLPFEAGWNEVHSANMRKVNAGPNGEGSKRDSPHDVIKPSGWVGPDLHKVLGQ